MVCQNMANISRVNQSNQNPTVQLHWDHENWLPEPMVSAGGVGGCPAFMSGMHWDPGICKAFDVSAASSCAMFLISVECKVKHTYFSVFDFPFMVSLLSFGDGLLPKLPGNSVRMVCFQGDPEVLQDDRGYLGLSGKTGSCKQGCFKNGRDLRKQTCTRC